LAPGGPAGPSKQPPNDNAKPQATADTKTRVLMLPPTPFACVEFSRDTIWRNPDGSQSKSDVRAMAECGRA